MCGCQEMALHLQDMPLWKAGGEGYGARRPQVTCHPYFKHQSDVLLDEATEAWALHLQNWSGVDQVRLVKLCDAMK